MVIEIHTLEKKEIEELLLSTTHFNIHYNKTKQYESVFKILVGMVKASDDKEVWCLVTNIARALSDKASALSIPRNKEVYYNNKQDIGSTRLFRVLDTLVENDYLVFYRGGFLGCMEDKVQSVYKFTDKMLSLWEGITLSTKHTDGSGVIIKNRDTKLELPTRGVVGVGIMNKEIAFYNSVIKTVDIEKDGVLICNQSYFRSFLDNLHTGGRWYNRTGAIQTMSQQERKKLTMNKENVVELDFKAMHPSILYERVWQADKTYVEDWIKQFMGGKYDPYFVDISSFIDCDNDKVIAYQQAHNLPRYNPIRNLVKFAVMAGINAKDVQKASGAISEEVYKEMKKWDDAETNSELKYYGIVIPPDHHGVHTFKTSFLCQAVRLSNGPIESFFFSDIGVELQYTDSQIISNVLSTFAEEGEVALSMHDSIIVRESLAERAEHLMRASYESVVGSSRFCVIERK